jgi:hypothetical protein
LPTEKDIEVEEEDYKQIYRITKIIKKIIIICIPTLGNLSCRPTSQQCCSLIPTCLKRTPAAQHALHATSTTMKQYKQNTK